LRKVFGGQAPPVPHRKSRSVIASRSFSWVLIVTVLVALALFGLWRVSRASRTAAKRILNEPDPMPSPGLRRLVELALETAKQVAISNGQDVLPFALTENGNPPTDAVYRFADAAGKAMNAGEYDSSVEMGFKRLASEQNDRAVLAFSGRVQHDGVRTDAIVLQAYERGDPVTFGFAQPYRLHEARRAGSLGGELLRIRDGPPEFARSPVPAASGLPRP